MRCAQERPYHGAIGAKGSPQKKEIMSTDTYDALAGADSLAARVGVAPIPLLLVALKQWRKIRKRIEEDGAMVAEELLTRGQEGRLLDSIG